MASGQNPPRIDKTSPAPAKTVLRVAMRQHRRRFVAALTGARRGDAFSRPPAELLAQFGPGRCVAAYTATADEADPAAFLASAADTGCTTALPWLVSGDPALRFRAWRPGDRLVDGPFRLLQPDDSAAIVAPDVIVTPLLAFDRAGNRLGHGKGYYDRAFASFPDALRIGLAWSVQEVEALPADPWDVPLHAICTEQQWITIP